MVEADRKPEHAEVAGVVYSVLTSLADGRLDGLRLHRATGMLVVEAGVHIRFGGIHGCYSH